MRSVSIRCSLLLVTLLSVLSLVAAGDKKKDCSSQGPAPTSVTSLQGMTADDVQALLAHPGLSSDVRSQIERLLQSGQKVHSHCEFYEKEINFLSAMPQRIVNHLKRYHIWKKMEDTCGISLLYAKDNENSGVVVKVKKGYLQGPILNFHALNGYDQILRNELLDWDFSWPKNVAFDYILPKYIPLVEEIACKKNYTLKSSVRLKCFIMPIEKALKLDAEIPEDVEFGPLPVDHLKKIHQAWLSRDMYTVNTLKDWYDVDRKYAVALFSKKTGAVLSSCMRSYNGGFAAVQTAPSARGKGYAKILVKKVCRMLAEDSIEPYYETAEHNSAALAVVQKVGFEFAFGVYSLIYTRGEEASDEST